MTIIRKVISKFTTRNIALQYELKKIQEHRVVRKSENKRRGKQVQRKEEESNANYDLQRVSVNFNT